MRAEQETFDKGFVSFSKHDAISSGCYQDNIVGFRSPILG